MKNKTSSEPVIVHQSSGRVRLKWKKLYHPALDVRYLEAWLTTLNGIKTARVNKNACSVTITFEELPELPHKLIDELTGCPAEVFGSKSPQSGNKRLIDAVTAGTLAGTSPFMPTPLQASVAYAMGIPAILSGLDTLINRGLKVEVLDMSTIGLSLLRKDYTTAASIASMVIIGDYLRQITEDRTNDLLRTLMLNPVEEVNVLKDGETQRIPYDYVLPGDIVLCQAGDLIPVDGVVTSGEALVNRSSISGESKPVHYRIADEIISGCSIIEGSLQIKAHKVGSETSMKRITHLMETSLLEKTVPEMRNDKLADMLAPISFGVSSAVYAVTQNANKALSALTVDYACAVKFPTPVVIKTSMYTAAQRNVLIKSGSALLQMSKVDTVVFDKTGSLTRGELIITDTICSEGYSPDKILTLAAAAENRSYHPVGRAIISETRRLSMEIPESAEAHSSIAHGVRAEVNGKLVRVGSHHYISEDCEIDCSCMDERASEFRSKGNILIYVTVEETVAGIIAMRDQIRPEASEVMRKLKEDGIKEIIILTGDHRETALSFLDTIDGADSIHWDLKPEKKAEIVRELKSKGRIVAFVGDGVNDAPSIIEADVGISVPESADLAREAAQISLTGKNLEGILLARKLGQRAEKTLNWCFKTGVGVNTGLMLAAISGYLTPVTTSIIHNMTTFSILGGAMLSSKREPKI